MEDKRVTLVYFATVTFDGFSEVEYHTDVSMIEEALHNVAENVRGATEYADFDTQENFKAIVISDDDIDEEQLVRMAANRMLDNREPVVAIDDTDGYVLTCDEFDLHDWVVSLNHTNSMPRNLVGPNGETYFTNVKLELSELDDVTEEPMLNEAAREELERAADELCQHISDFDALVHQIAEYTC